MMKQRFGMKDIFILGFCRGGGADCMLQLL